MRLSFASALLVVGGVSALTVPLPSAPALPLASFPPNPFVNPLSLDEARNAKLTNDTAPTETATPKVNTFAVKAAATCTSPRVRWEWDQASTDTRRAYTSAIKCLMNKPSAGGFGASKSRYEDIVSVHQQYTPNVHGNSKFLIWHRYYVWAFEQILRNECGFNNDMPWFDETKYAGRYSQSSIFSNDWYGAIAIGGQCVTNGLFAGLTLNIGPGSGNTVHCLSRNGDASKTANTNSDMVNACNARTDYKDMASCAEGGAHAWGHNGIGAVMADVYASPGDPVFFLHHAFIDRNFRIWQNADSARVTYIDGTDASGNALTLDTTMNVKGLVPDVTVRDFINTLDGKACYRYNY